MGHPRTLGGGAGVYFDRRGLRPPHGRPVAISAPGACPAPAGERRHLGCRWRCGIAPPRCSPSWPNKLSTSRIPLPWRRVRSRSRAPSRPWLGPAVATKTSGARPQLSRCAACAAWANARSARAGQRVSCGPSRCSVGLRPAAGNCAAAGCLRWLAVAPAKAGNLRQRSFSEPIRELPQLREGDRHLHSSRAAEEAAPPAQRSEHDHGVFVRSSPFQRQQFFTARPPRHPALASNDTAVLLRRRPAPGRPVACGPTNQLHEGGCAAAEPAARGAAASTTCCPPCRPNQQRSPAEALMATRRWAQSPLWAVAPSSGLLMACGRPGR